MKSWLTPGLLGVVAALLALNWISPADSAVTGGGSTWSVACGGGMCVALDGAGNSYWGLREEGAAGYGFHWYVAGNMREAEPFGLAACRQRIERFQQDRAVLAERLAKLPDPNNSAQSGGDAMEGAQQRMLARIERMDAQKTLDKLVAEQGPPAEECRKLIELMR